MKRSEVDWARLDPVEGSEYGKARPCVIVDGKRFDLEALTISVQSFRTPKIAGELASLLSVVGRARGGVRGAAAPALADSIFR